MDDRTPSVLRKATDYLRQGWTQQVPAVDANGDTVLTFANEATAWCGIGALDRAVVLHINGNDDTRTDVFADALEAVDKMLDGVTLPVYNDDAKRTQADMVRLFEAATAHAEKLL